jgi:hypothetical protein
MLTRLRDSDAVLTGSRLEASKKGATGGSMRHYSPSLLWTSSPKAHLSNVSQIRRILYPDLGK